MKSVVITVWLLAAAWPLTGAERLTLQQCIDLAVSRNAGIQVAEEGRAGAVLKIGESRSQYLPQVTLSASYSRVSTASEFTIPFNGQMTTFKFMSPNNYGIKLTAAEQLFNWGRTARAVELSRKGVELADDAVQLSRQAIAFQAVSLYHGTLFFQAAARVVDEHLSLYEKKVQTTRTRFAAGLASDYDLSLMQIQIAALQQQRLDLDNSLRKLAHAFNRLCGRNDAEPFVPDGELQLTPVTVDRDALLAEAWGSRPEAQQARHQEELARIQEQLSRTGNKPSVAASFIYQVQNGIMPNVDRLRGNWTLALSAAWPLFDGLRTRAQVGQARSALQATQRRLTDQQQAIALEIDNSISELATLAGKIDMENTKIGHAEKTLAIAEQRYREGQISATDLIEAQNGLAAARLNWLQLVYNHTMERFNLDRAVGRKLF